MHKKLSYYPVILSAIGLSGILLYLLARNRNPSKIIRSVLKNSDFEELTPFVIAQARLESANFTSDLFKRSNNLFGMKNAITRNQLGHRSAIPGDNYRSYDSSRQSVEDFLLYLYAVRFPGSVADAFDYAQELKDRGYYGVSSQEYSSGLNSWLT